MQKAIESSSNTKIPTITVIVCAYTEDRWEDLILVMKSLSNQTLQPDEIIIVVDHNPVLYERAKQSWNAIIIENQEERGLSGARNSAIKVSQGEWLVFIDEDAVAMEDWLERLAGHFHKAELLGVGGSIKPDWQAGRPGWFPPEFDWVVGCTYTGMPKDVSQVRNLIGCNMAFHRRVFTGVGGFRSGIGRIGTVPLGCEETELCIRAQQNWTDGQFLFDPSALVVHKVPEKRSNWRYFRSRCYAEGISKAVVSSYVGSKDGLNSEWTYVLQTLPKGILHGVVDSISGKDSSGWGRAAAITLGFITTSWGYLVGKLTQTFRNSGRSMLVGSKKKVSDQSRDIYPLS